MSLAELVQSSGWKNFISKLYGLGASVVIIGALFKIQHWPLAGTMLTIGLITEAVIFFFSAFEPLHEEIDWSLVYPELAGIPEEDSQELVSHGGKYQGAVSGGGGGVMVAAAVQDQLPFQNSTKCSKKLKSLPTCSRNLALE
jgi:gliding motility-associated protein GldL